MASSNEQQIGDLIVYAFVMLAGCGLASAYFLEPDFFPRDTTWFSSLKYALWDRPEGDRILGRGTLYWAIAKYALLIGLPTLVVAFFGVVSLTEVGEDALNAILIVWAVLAGLVLLATVWLLGPNQTIIGYAGIWRSEKSYIGFDLTSRRPSIFGSENGRDFQSLPVRLTHLDKNTGALTLTGLKLAESGRDLPMTFRTRMADGNRVVEIDDEVAKKKETFIFLRPITDTDQKNIMPSDKWQTQEIELTNRCSKAIWARRPDIILHHVTPLLDSTVFPAMYRRSSGNWAILILSSTRPEPNRMLGETFTSRCEFASKGVELSSCNGGYRDCYD